MSSNYNIELKNVGKVKIQKKRSMKSIRLRIDKDGMPVVSAPWHVSKPVIYKFLTDKSDWIQANSDNNKLIYRDGIQLACGIKLSIQDGFNKNYSKSEGKVLNIKIKESFTPENIKQQNYIEKRILNAMSELAENQLLPRLLKISEQTKINFNQAYVKKLHSRWGSCDQSKNIVLNIFLTQIPNDLVDYVIVHELMHTIHLNHSKDFWADVGKFLPSYKELRKDLKGYKTRIIAVDS